MRVATWNLLHGMDIRAGRVDLGAVADGIAALDADVVAVQEVDRELDRSGGVDQLAALAEKLGWHGAFAPALLGEPVRRWDALPERGPDPGGPAYGIGLLSPHPLLGVQRLALPGGADRLRRSAPVEALEQRPPGWDREPRIVLRARVAHPDGELVVASTHLSYMVWLGVRQLRRALTWTADGGPAVLLGDLNLPRRPLGVALTGSGWTAGDPGAPTYPAWRPRMQLDHVLVHQAQLRSVRVAARGTSDHLAVTAEVDTG